MNIKTCDKCGGKINTNPMGNKILPIFAINKLTIFDVGWRPVDLCPRCEKKLEKWLKTHEEDEQ